MIILFMNTVVLSVLCKTNVIVGDGLDYNNNMTFSTPDQDNDRDSSGNCATYWRSAWWFNGCTWANPNGQYTDFEKTGWEYIVWYHWKKSLISLKSIQLMIRPRA